MSVVRLSFALIRHFNRDDRHFEWKVIAGIRRLNFQPPVSRKTAFESADTPRPRKWHGWMVVHASRGSLHTHAHPSLSLSRSIHPASWYRETKRRPRWHQSDRWRKIDEVVAFGISYWLTSFAAHERIKISSNALLCARPLFGASFEWPRKKILWQSNMSREDASFVRKLFLWELR